jgi:hypothetical protein
MVKKLLLNSLKLGQGSNMLLKNDTKKCDIHNESKTCLNMESAYLFIHSWLIEQRFQLFKLYSVRAYPGTCLYRWRKVT